MEYTLNRQKTVTPRQTKTSSITITPIITPTTYKHARAGSFGKVGSLHEPPSTSFRASKHSFLDSFSRRQASIVELSSDMERLLEKQIQKKDAGRYEINVGHLKFEFNHEDELFKLTKPKGQQQGNKTCNSCSFKVPKPKRRYCDFCGFLNCEKCMHKRR